MNTRLLRLRALLILTIALNTIIGPHAQGQTTGTPSHYGMAQWHHDVVYYIMVDRFATSEGDGSVPRLSNGAAFHSGSLEGIINKLDYLKELGVTAILLNPVTESDGYHGYSVRNLYKISPRFGGEPAYQKLVSEVHKRGMKILFDLVLNHTSGRAKLRKEHPDWYRKEMKPRALNDGLIPQVWARSQFVTLSDLIQEKEEVYQYLLGAALAWTKTGIDGFRMDAVTLIEPIFWKRFNAEIQKRVKRDFLILGEIFNSDPQYLNQYLPSFNAFFDFPTWWTISEIFFGRKSASEIRFMWMLDQIYPPPTSSPLYFH